MVLLPPCSSSEPSESSSDDRDIFGYMSSSVATGLINFVATRWSISLIETSQNLNLLPLCGVLNKTGETDWLDSV